MSKNSRRVQTCNPCENNARKNVTRQGSYFTWPVPAWKEEAHRPGFYQNVKFKSYKTYNEGE
jgi:hypothetical protein